MKIYKTAQVPPGYVILKTTIKGNTVKEEFVREGQTPCNEKDAQFLKELMEAEIPGFGGAKVTDGGHTSEWFEQNRPKVRAPAKQETEDEFGTPAAPQSPQRQGYGV